MLYKIMHQNIAIVLMYIHCRSQMVRVSNHRRDRTMSVLLMTIVMVFIICNTARVTCNLFEAIQVDKSRRKKLMIQRLYCNGNKLDREVFKKKVWKFSTIGWVGLGFFCPLRIHFGPFLAILTKKLSNIFHTSGGGESVENFHTFYFLKASLIGQLSIFYSNFWENVRRHSLRD